MKIIIALMICIIFLCGCSTEQTNSVRDTYPQNSVSSSQLQDSVSTTQLQQDMQDSLSAYHQAFLGYPISLKEFSIQKSISENRSFSAQIDVIAESAYAAFQYIANIQYSLYDQGWMLDNCNWEFVGYNVVCYPDENDLIKIKEESNISQQKEISLICENGTVVYRGEDIIDWSPAACCSKAIDITWGYNAHTDWWDIVATSSTIEDESCILYSALEGEWMLNEDGTVVISNVADDGFDIEINDIHYETDKFHVEVGNVVIRDDGNSVLIKFTSDQFDFRDPKYHHSDFYDDFRGIASISVILYKDTQTIAGQEYNTYFNIILNNLSGLGVDAYGSDLYCLIK